MTTPSLTTDEGVAQLRSILAEARADLVERLRLPDLLADIDHARAAIDRVRDLHRPRRLGRGYPGGGTVCTTCRSVASLPVPYPCPTIRALDSADAAPCGGR